MTNPQIEAPFDRRINDIIQRNQSRSPDDRAKDDINWLLMWLASYKGQSEGCKQAIDDIKQWKNEGTIRARLKNSEILESHDRNIRSPIHN